MKTNLSSDRSVVLKVECLRDNLVKCFSVKNDFIRAIKNAGNVTIFLKLCKSSVLISLALWSEINLYIAVPGMCFTHYLYI